MRNRTRSREYALQMLYQADIRHVGHEQIQQEFWQESESVDTEVTAFANALFEGTVARRAEIDASIADYADNWNMKRMAVIDRNILRLGVYELLHQTDVPSKVCINEAIELAKRFGDTDSSKFINGILDRVKNESQLSQSAP